MEKSKNISFCDRMLDLSVSTGLVTITPFFWSLALAVVAAFFSFWRRLKEDFREETIFKLSLSALGATLVVLLLSTLGHLGGRIAVPAAYLAAALVVGWRVWRDKKNVWEVLDALILPLFYCLFLGGLGFFLNTFSYWNLAYLVIGLLGFSTFPFIKKKYRSFAWYKSGKTGFLASFYSLFFFFSLLILEFLKEGALYLDCLFLVVLVLLTLGTLYYRSERNLRGDLRLFK